MVRYWEVRAQKQSLFANLFDDRFVVDILSDLLNHAGYFPGLSFFHAPCGDRRRADSQATGIGRRGRIVRDAIVVGHDACPVQRLCEFFAGDILISQVDEDQVIIRAAGHEIEAVFEQHLGQGLGVPDDLSSVGDELRRVGLGHRYRDCGHCVHMRPALEAGENGPVHVVVVFGLAQQHAAARAA